MEGKERIRIERYYCNHCGESVKGEWKALRDEGWGYIEISCGAALDPPGILPLRHATTVRAIYCPLHESEVIRSAELAHHLLDGPGNRARVRRGALR